MKKERVKAPVRGPRTVLIIDYNNVPTMLSGHSLLAQLDHMDPSRYNVVVVFNRPCDAEHAAAQRGIETAIVSHGGGSPFRRFWQYGRLPFALWLLAKQVKPSIIHANNAMAGRVAMVLKALTGLPVIVQLRNIGLPPRTSLLVLRADHFAAVSTTTTEETLPPNARLQATVVLDGLELADYPLNGSITQVSARRALGLPLDPLVVGMAGRLSEQKGQRYYIEAAKEILACRSDVVFTHAGKIPSIDSSDPYERELAVMSAHMSATGRFRWLNYVDCIAQFWAAVDIAVAPSCGPEAFGRVLIEAMAMQRPVIATPAGGPQEIVEAPDSGFLVPMGDNRALAVAITELLIDPVKRQQMGVAARTRVEHLFSADIYAQRMMDLYDRVLDTAK